MKEVFMGSVAKKVLLHLNELVCVSFINLLLSMRYLQHIYQHKRRFENVG